MKMIVLVKLAVSVATKDASWDSIKSDIPRYQGAHGGLGFTLEVPAVSKQAM